MARTKASVGAKVASGKSSKVRCSAAPPPPSSSGSSGSSERTARGSSGGGNPVCQRETPKWQRPITTFFINKDTNESNHVEEDDACSSKSKPRPKRNIIESDDEEPVNVDEPPKNTVLDETIELEPLTGENSHRLEEYYPKNGEKGKGVGKKTKNKENIDINIGRKSVKRDLDDNFEESIAKKLKV